MAAESAHKLQFPDPRIAQMRHNIFKYIILSMVCMIFVAPKVQAQAMDDGKICSAAIANVEQKSQVPNNVLQAISRVESGRKDPISKKYTAWPWTVNANGQGYFLNSKYEAMQLVRHLQSRGIKSIDVGCMQINLWHHKQAFDSLDEAFDPVSNVRYAAKFLQGLYNDSKSWITAIGNYHSATPQFHENYKKKVITHLNQLNKNQPDGSQTQITSTEPTNTISVPSAPIKNVATRAKSTPANYANAKYSATVRYTNMTIFEADAARKAAVLAAWQERERRLAKRQQLADSRR